MRKKLKFLKIPSISDVPEDDLFYEESENLSDLFRKDDLSTPELIGPEISSQNSLFNISTPNWLVPLASQIFNLNFEENKLSLLDFIDRKIII